MFFKHSRINLTSTGAKSSELANLGKELFRAAYGIRV
jgi:hypothetical protein